MSDLFSRLRMTDIAAWPQSVQAMAWRAPWLSVPLLQDTDTGLWHSEGDVPESAPHDLMPKLAIKSWQETGRLRLIPHGLPLAPALDARLASPTAQQNAVLKAWAEVEKQPFLHLFEWTDMQKVTEARFSWSQGKVAVTSTCRRNSVGVQSSDLAPTLHYIAEQMPNLGNFIVQFAITETGETRILDINPLLSQDDLISITGQAA